MNSARAWLTYVPLLSKGERPLDECISLLKESLLKGEQPQLVNALFERACNLQCRHCLLPEHSTTRAISEEAGLDKILENLAMQLSRLEPTNDGWKPSFLHEGRIVMPWHLDVLSKLQILAPKVNYGLIDNGSYTYLLKKFRQSGVVLDWIDISCDGTKESHNAQRDPKGRSHDYMFSGLAHARGIVRNPSDGGRVSSLMTLTSLNFGDIEKVAENLFRPNHLHSSFNYTDELHVSTINPKQPTNYMIDLNQEQVRTAFESVRELQQDKQPVYFRLYNAKHLGLLGRVVGAEAFKNSLARARAYSHGVIGLELDGVTTYYAPSSIWPAEGIFVDANGAQRVAYAQAHTLQQLEDPAFAKYTVQQLSEATMLKQAHEANVIVWTDNFMAHFLKQECDVFRRILKS